MDVRLVGHRSFQPFLLALLLVIESVLSDGGDSTHYSEAADAPPHYERLGDGAARLQFHANEQNPWHDMLGVWKVEATGPDAPWPSGVRVFRADEANGDPVWHARTCVTSQEDFEPRFRLTTNSYRTWTKKGKGKATFRIRKKHGKCWDGTCGRLLVDNVLSLEEAQSAMRELAASMRPAKGGNGPGHALHSPKFSFVKERVGRLMSHHFNMSDLNPLHLQPAFYDPPTCELHFDDDLVSAVLYTTEFETNPAGETSIPSGGETVFVDEVDGDGVMVTGWVVQPRPGRLIMWSAGAENLHCKTPHRGTRLAFFFSTGCGSSSSDSVRAEL